VKNRKLKYSDGLGNSFIGHTEMKTKTKLIGISGKARSGKDEIASHLWAQYGFTRISMAYPLKQAAQYAFGLTNAQAFNDQYKEIVIPYWGLSPRQMWQKLGRTARETFGDDIWVKRWRLSYASIMDTDDVVVPDIRHDWELYEVRSLGGIVVEIRRDRAGLFGSTADDVSEAGLSVPPDYIIDNNGTLAELRQSVDLLIESLA
jgi:hypothetical protein